MCAGGGDKSECGVLIRLAANSRVFDLTLEWVNSQKTLIGSSYSDNSVWA